MMQSFYKILLGLALAVTPAQAIAKNALDKIHQEIATDYPTVTHISRADLQEQLEAENIIILDTRPAREYNVSHIPGALQVDPDMDESAFRTKFGAQLKDKTLIVYCSVGRRSSILGERLQSAALEAGAKRVDNMEGGIFGWHNDKRPLEDANGATTSIHPYNAFWGRLIENKSGIRYKAEK